MLLVSFTILNIYFYLLYAYDFEEKQYYLLILLKMTNSLNYIK